MSSLILSLVFLFIYAITDFKHEYLFIAAIIMLAAADIRNDIRNKE